MSAFSRSVVLVFLWGGVFGRGAMSHVCTAIAGVPPITQRRRPSGSRIGGKPPKTLAGSVD